MIWVLDPNRKMLRPELYVLWNAYINRVVILIGCAKCIIRYVPRTIYLNVLQYVPWTNPMLFTMNHVPYTYVCSTKPVLKCMCHVLPGCVSLMYRTMHTWRHMHIKYALCCTMHHVLYHEPDAPKQTLIPHTQQTRYSSSKRSSSSRSSRCNHAQ